MKPTDPAKLRARTVNFKRGEMARETIQLHYPGMPLVDFLTDFMHADRNLRQEIAKICEQACANYDREHEAEIEED